MENQVNVAHYISELLFLHDCVVVPGFGGFVCTYAPARIHPAQHTFHPPSKQLVFNRHLQQNDGLLAHAIASAVPCSFAESMQAIEAFAAETSTALKAGKQVHLHHIGRLSLDPERNIRFEADEEVNFLIESFGLGTFQSMPVLRETTEQPVVQTEPVRPLPPRENKVKADERPPVTARPLITRRRAIAAAILVPLAALAIWLPMQRLNNVQMAGFNWSNSTTTGKYLPVNWFKQLQPASDKFPLPPDLRNDTSGNLYITLDNGQPLPVSRHIAAPESTRVEMPQQPQAAPQAVQAGTFYVIGGAFSVPANAENYRKLLESKGYPTTLLQNVKGTLTHISIASFTSREEAERFMRTIQDSVSGAWILKR
jgi:hypothetical protein